MSLRGLSFAASGLVGRSTLLRNVHSRRDSSGSASTSQSIAYLLPVSPDLPSSQFDDKADTDLTKFGSDTGTKELWSLFLHERAKRNTTRVYPHFQNLVGLVSLGDRFNTRPISTKLEFYRQAVGSGYKSLAEAGAREIIVEPGEYPHAAAVGSHLAAFSFSLKTTKQNNLPLIHPSRDLHGYARHEWNNGVIYARAQNLTRELAELPGNFVTPTNFCDRISKAAEHLPHVKVLVRDKEWAETIGMRAFLSVAQGSSEPPRFLEIHYTGLGDRSNELALVGKGVTFDSGGISIKPANGMKDMRADMTGAASVASATLAAAELKLPINIVTCVPLCENMLGPSANKPGDIVYAMNGKSVEIDNTDAEGRLILADALHYATTTYKPETVIDVATLTGAMRIALGDVYSGVFTNSDSLWGEVHLAGEAEFDRFWRMPLDEEYGPQIYTSNADLCNVGGPAGGSCTAALFLKAFVNGVDDGVRWAHIDIAGTMMASLESPYQKKGMTGRSTRGLIEFARRLSERNLTKA